jgi:hypothetical protein
MQFSSTIRANRFVTPHHESRNSRMLLGWASPSGAPHARQAPSPTGFATPQKSHVRRAKRSESSCDAPKVAMVRSINFQTLIAKLNIFNILRQIIQPTKQIKRIPQCRPRRLTEARRNSQPCLFAQLDHDPILSFLNVDRERGLPARYGTRSCGDLY